MKDVLQSNIHQYNWKHIKGYEKDGIWIVSEDDTNQIVIKAYKNSIVFELYLFDGLIITLLTEKNIDRIPNQIGNLYSNWDRMIKYYKETKSEMLKNLNKLLNL